MFAKTLLRGTRFKSLSRAKTKKEKVLKDVIRLLYSQCHACVPQ